MFTQANSAIQNRDLWMTRDSAGFGRLCRLEPFLCMMIMTPASCPKLRRNFSTS